MPHDRLGGTGIKLGAPVGTTTTKPGAHPARISHLMSPVSPTDLMQLQRTIGNQAVSRLLKANREPSLRPAVQRRLRVDAQALPSPSTTAKADESTYTLIHAALKAYHSVPRTYSSAAEKRQYSADRVTWLEALDTLCRKWLKDHSTAKLRLIPGQQTKDAAKRQAVQTLLNEVTKDLVFSGTFQGGSSEKKGEMANALIAATGSHRFAFVKGARKQLLTAQTPGQQQAIAAGLSPGEPELLKTYTDLRENRGLLSKEVKAIGAYTDDQYRLMNPTGAGGGAWLSNQLAKKGRQTDAASVAKALEVNKAINEVAQSGLGKLPPWQHAGTIYRGETFPSEEAVKFESGYVKTYPHFVSTSQTVDVARTMAADNKDESRPIKVIWHIVQSSGGRDIMALSTTTEQEILFPPGTTFTIVGVQKTRRGLAKADHIEVKAKVEAPQGF